PTDLKEGRASWSDVDRSGLRIIATQLRHYASTLDREPNEDVVFSAQHRALAHEAAREAVVLLKNDEVGGVPLLPLDAAGIRRLAVIGAL
ncbi:hypothetical protein SB767_31485, partial [Bacillus sp. SIMBA_069]